jgi:hypothetical protein
MKARYIIGVVMLISVWMTDCAKEESAAKRDDDKQTRASPLGDLPPPKPKVVHEPTRPARRCDGRPVEPCARGRTGPGCDLPCDAGWGMCGYRLYCHSDGRQAGLLAEGATLFNLAGGADPGERAKQWAVEHANSAGMMPRIWMNDLDIVKFAEPVAHGRLFVHRYEQKYRGLRVLGPDRIITISGKGDKVLSIGGGWVDSRPDYLHYKRHASRADAERALRHHSLSLAGKARRPAVGIRDVMLAAVPSEKRVVWTGGVFIGGVFTGRLVVDADPKGEKPLRLLSFDDGTYSGIDDIEQIYVKSQNLAADVTDDDDDTFDLLDTNNLSDGSPLLGSWVDASEDPSQPLQLATPRLFLRDMQGHSLETDPANLLRVTSPTGNFQEGSGAGLSSQRTYHLTQSFYEIANQHLTDPSDPKITRWDSLLGATSGFPSGEFKPRGGIFLDSGVKCPTPGATACVYEQEIPSEGNFPDEFTP